MTKNELSYTTGKQYWEKVPPTLDGVLGGFGFISQADIRGSKQFLKQLFQSKEPPGREYALDCGAGIGRVSRFLLTDVFEKVDLVEQNGNFLQKARSYLGEKCVGKVGEFFQEGLQDFRPEQGKYDVIWIQWVLGHLTDEDLVEFLKSCKEGLKTNGLIIVKENTTSSGEIEVDTVDSSVTRPVKGFREIFANAGLDCWRVVKQNNFPKGIYAVHMFALKPQNLTSDKQEVNTELEKLSIDNSTKDNE